MAKKNRQPDTSGYKTETQLKEEALRRIEEQRKIDALKKPPPPLKKKRENFWYHYKWHTIAGAAAVLLLGFFLRDMIFRTQPDTTILMTTNRYYDAATIEALEQALTERASDFNGDGKVSIVIDYVNSPAQPTEEELAEMDPLEQMTAGGGQQDYANTMKLTTMVAAGMDPIYIVDDGMYDYFLRMSAGTYDDEGNLLPMPENPESMFQILEGVPGAEGDRLPLTNTSLAGVEGLGDLEGLSICIRLEQAMSRPKAGYYDYCMGLLETLADASSR